MLALYIYLAAMESKCFNSVCMYVCMYVWL